MDLKNVKSWQIAAAVFFLQLIVMIITYRKDYSIFDFVIFTIATITILVLLHSEKEHIKKIGAYLIVLWGFIKINVTKGKFIMWLFSWPTSIEGIGPKSSVELIVGLLYLITGIYYLWKKE